MGTLRSHLGLVLAYLQVNVQIALEYRASLVIQVFSMFVNDGMWLAFWWLYFTRFPVLKGWERTDIVVLWATLALGYGLATGVAGNLERLSGIIYRGQLDYYLALPKDTLTHALIGRMGIYALGDSLFGLMVFLLLANPTPTRLLLFVGSAVVVALYFVAFGILTHSFAFFLGNAEQFSMQLHNALVHFSTYPSAIFGGVTRFLLFTALPAGFLNSIPVEIIRHFNPLFALVLVGFGTGLMALAIVVFRRGLRRYESGNLLVMRD